MKTVTLKGKAKISYNIPNIKVSFNKTSSGAREVDKIAIKSGTVVYTVYDKNKGRVSEKAKTLVLKYLKKLKAKYNTADVN